MKFTLPHQPFLPPRGFFANGTIVLANTGLSVSATLETSVMGFQMTVSGAVNSNGSFSFKQSFGINSGPVHSNLTLTLANTGFSSDFNFGVDVTTNAPGFTVGFRGSIDVGFSINTDGTFRANGNLTMTAYLGISASASIGFSIDNHNFIIHTGDIGFSVGPFSYHPFSDVSITY